MGLFKGMKDLKALGEVAAEHGGAVDLRVGA